MTDSYTNVQTMDVILTLLNNTLPTHPLLNSTESYAEFVQLAKERGCPTTSLGYSWDDTQIDVNQVEMELYPNALAERLGW